MNSINDVIILLYLPKISGKADTASIQTYCGSISSALMNYDATNGVIFFNELQEPTTDNMDGGYNAISSFIQLIQITKIMAAVTSGTFNWKDYRIWGGAYQNSVIVYNGYNQIG